MRNTVLTNELVLSQFIPYQFPKYIELTTEIERLKLIGKINYTEDEIFTIGGKKYIQYKLELGAVCGCGTPRVTEVKIDFA